MSMIKLIPPRAYAAFDDLPQAEAVKSAASGFRGLDLAAFVKRASHPLALWVQQNSPKPGEVYVHSHIYGVTERVGCFFAGAQIETATGSRAIETVAVGDRVLTHVNRYRSVTNVFRAPHTGARVTLRMSGMPLPITCTAEHPFWVVRRSDFGASARCEAYLVRKGKTKTGTVDAVINERAQFTTADSLVKGDYLIVPVRPEPVGEHAIRFDPYLLGTYLAEGCISRETRRIPTHGKPRRVIFSLHKHDDQPILDYLRAAIDRSVQVGPSLTSDLGMRVEISHNDLAAECLRLFGNDSTTKRIPLAVYAQSTDWKLKFVAGYMDGDGCVTRTGPSRTRGTINGSTASIDLALGIQRLLAGVGIPSAVTRGYNRVRNGCFGTTDRVIYQLRIGSAYAPAVLANCLRLKSPDGTPTRRFKQAAAQIGTTHMLVPVADVTVDNVSNETKYNLEVDEDHTFIVNGVAVHNCNRNHDAYGIKMSRADLPSYEQFGRAYRNHQNRHPERAMGVVKKAYLNEPMGRAEVIVALNGTKEAADRNGGVTADRTLEKLAGNEDIAVSQSCKIQFDRCVSCGNEAKTRLEYCCGPSEGGTCKYGGCRTHLGRVADDGFQLYVDNPKCVFFDWSDVADTRGADRTAFITGKVAGADRVPGGAELAEMLNLVPPEHLLDPTVKFALARARELAGRTAPTGSADWATIVATRAKLARVAPVPPAFTGSDATRHHGIAELARAGVVLPPDIWLSAATGVDPVKCAAALGGPADVARDLLSRPDAYDLVSASTFDGPVAPNHWLAPSVRAHALESHRVVLGGTKVSHAAVLPPAKSAELRARYAAYQMGVLAIHKNSGNLDLISAECLRHNS
jgi:hypothetical protein